MKTPSARGSPPEGRASRRRSLTGSLDAPQIPVQHFDATTGTTLKSHACHSRRLFPLGNPYQGERRDVEPQPDILRSCTTTIAVCWIALVAVWVAAWLHDRPHAPAARKRAPFPRWLLIVMLAYLLTGAIVPRDFWSLLTFRPQPGVQYAGAIIVALSTAFAFWARIVLGTMWSVLAIAKVGHELRTTGPYSITRHPFTRQFSACRSDRPWRYVAVSGVWLSSRSLLQSSQRYIQRKSSSFERSVTTTGLTSAA